jgi:hypothetical protein
VALCNTCGRYFALCLATSSEIVDAVARVDTDLRSLFARPSIVVARLAARAASRGVLEGRLAPDASTVPLGQLLRRAGADADADVDARAGARRASDAHACIIVIALSVTRIARVARARVTTTHARARVRPQS